MSKNTKQFNWAVNLDDALRQPVRIEAAKADKSISEFLSDFLAEKLPLTGVA